MSLIPTVPCRVYQKSKERGVLEFSWLVIEIDQEIWLEDRGAMCSLKSKCPTNERKETSLKVPAVLSTNSSEFQLELIAVLGLKTKATPTATGLDRVRPASTGPGGNVGLGSRLSSLADYGAGKDSDLCLLTMNMYSIQYIYICVLYIYTVHVHIMSTNRI